GRGARPLGFLEEPLDPGDPPARTGERCPRPDVPVAGLDARRLDAERDQRVAPLRRVEGETQIGPEGRPLPDGMVRREDRHDRRRVTPADLEGGEGGGGRARQMEAGGLGARGGGGGRGGAEGEGGGGEGGRRRAPRGGGLAAPAENREELLGRARAAAGPEAGSGPARQHDGVAGSACHRLKTGLLCREVARPLPFRLRLSEKQEGT